MDPNVALNYLTGSALIFKNAESSIPATGAAFSSKPYRSLRCTKLLV